MEKKTAGILATIFTVLFCGCPGLFGICFGGAFLIGGNAPGADIDVFGSSDPKAAMAAGIATICVSLILVVIPIAVGFFSLRNKEEAANVVMDGPLPPSM